jgi:4-hydroxybenzoate polyprenyltransferase
MTDVSIPGSRSDQPYEAGSAAQQAAGGGWGRLAVAASIGRLHIVAIAVMGCFTFGWIFTGHYPWGLAAVCGLDWFVVNLLNRVVDLEEDQVNRIRGTGFVARHRKAVLVVGFGALGISLVAVALWEPVITPLRLGYHLLGFAYNWALLPGGRRIKELYFFKNTASATGFMITVFGYPLAAAHWGHGAALGGAGLAADVTLATVAVAGVFFFLFELSYEVIYDLRDAPGDRAAGVRSFPVVHGERGALRIIDSLIGASVVVLVSGYLLGGVPWRLCIMFAAPVIQLVVYKGMVRRGITSADCIGLTWLGVALLVLYHLWVVLELPGVRGF